MARHRHKRRQPLPRDIVEARIESLSPEGRGVARVEGKAVFVADTLPGETVAFRYTALYRDYAEGALEQVLEAAPERIEPPCPHFSQCGGCNLQHLGPEDQVAHKQAQLLEQLRRIGKVEPAEVFAPITGPAWGYRHRARLSVKYVAPKGRVIVGFREKASSFVANLDACLVLHPAVGEKLTELGKLIHDLSLREKIPQVEVALGDSRHALVFRNLAAATPADEEAFKAFGQQHGFDIYLQPKGPDSVTLLYPDAAPQPSYTLEGLEFRFSPTEFTQVNPFINRQMVARALELLDPQENESVLDLFCGLGNFTLPLARRAKHVVGVEGDEALVARARDNARHNGIANAAFFSADLFHEVSDAPWAKRHYDKILLDPSRAGAQEIVRELPRLGARRMVYVSCNPATLARDAGVLVHEDGWKLKGAGIMDMFPHTAHVESIALFER